MGVFVTIGLRDIFGTEVDGLYVGLLVVGRDVGINVDGLVDSKYFETIIGLADVRIVVGITAIIGFADVGFVVGTASVFCFCKVRWMFFFVVISVFFIVFLVLILDDFSSLISASVFD